MGQERNPRLLIGIAVLRSGEPVTYASGDPESETRANEENRNLLWKLKLRKE
jgi:hypothetical protein